MFPSSLLSYLLIAVTLGSVSASPIVKESPRGVLPFTARFGGETASFANIIEKDRARIAAIKEKGAAVAGAHEHKRSSYSFSVTNAAVTYFASVSVGSPATTYTLLIDTGSSNTWVGAGKSYKPTRTSTNTGNSVSVSYGSGSFSGTEYIDTVSLSSSLVIKQQSIGVADTATGFDGEDGILGIGPTDLTSQTVDNTDTVPTVTDNLAAQGSISGAVVGIYYAPTTSSSTKNGELTFGGADSSKYTGSLHYVPITSTSPASQYWGIDQTISYGSTTILKSSGIVDTGTTLLYLATDAFNKYKSATGGKADSATGLLSISSSQYAALKTLNFNIGGTTFGMIPNAQIWPRSLNSMLGGSSSKIYLVAVDMGTPSGQGLDFINGYAFLERFYTVYDTDNSRMGFATTAHTADTSN